MSSYSLGGYLAAVKIRGGRNLLLEGPTDQKLVARVIAELDRQEGWFDASVTLDTVDLLSDPELPPGNRQAVEYVYHLAEAEALPLAALVDREFREFDIDVEIRDNLRGHYQASGLYWTRGHSIENYLFDVRYVETYLRMKHPESLSRECYELVGNEFPRIIMAAAAASMAAKTYEVIERCGGLCQQHFWIYSREDGLQLDIDTFVKSLLGRGVRPELANQFGEAFQRLHSAVSYNSDSDLARWITHGHLGWNFVWTGVARLVEECGAPEEVIQAIGRGFLEEKLRFMSNQWAPEAIQDPGKSPTNLWAWLSNAA